MFFSKLFTRDSDAEESLATWRALQNNTGVKPTIGNRQTGVAKSMREMMMAEIIRSRLGLLGGFRANKTSPVKSVSKMSWDSAGVDVFSDFHFDKLINRALDQRTFVDMMRKPAGGRFEDTEFYKMCDDIMQGDKTVKARGFLRLHQALLDQMDYFLDKYKIQNWLGKTNEKICKEINLEEFSRDYSFLKDYNSVFNDCKSGELKATLSSPYEGTEIMSHYRTVGMIALSCHNLNFLTNYIVDEKGDKSFIKGYLSEKFNLSIGGSLLNMSESELKAELKQHDRLKKLRKACDAANKANSEAKEREIIEEAMRKDADYSYTDYNPTPEDEALKEKMNATMIGEWKKSAGAQLMWNGKIAFQGFHFNRFIDDAVMQKTCLDMMNESEGETFENTDFFKMCADMVSDQEDSKLRGFRKAQKVLLDQMDYFLERYDIGKWHGMMIIDIYKNVESKYGLMQYIRDLKFIQNYNQMFENCDEDLRNKLNYEDKGIIEHYNKFCQISDPCATLKSAKALLSSVSTDAQEGVKDSIDLLKLKNKFDLGKGNFSSREVLEALANHDRIKKLRASYDKAIGI